MNADGLLEVVSDISEQLIEKQIYDYAYILKCDFRSIPGANFKASGARQSDYHFMI